MERLSKDPAAPRWLRDALQEAADEKASPEVLKQVLGATAFGAGAAVLAAKAAGKASPFATALFGASGVAKGVVAVVIFVAGGVAGGYAVHEHDVRQAGLVTPRPQPVSQVLPAPLTPVEKAARALAPSPDEALRPVSVAVAPAPAPRAPSRRAAEAALPATVLAAAGDAPRAPSPVEPDTPAAQALAPSWREQLAGLRAIRDAAAAERPDDALAAIDAYRRRFPAPVFDQELLFLEAQARSTRADPAACGVLDRLTSTYPASLLLPRARALRVSAGCMPSTR